MAYSDDSRFFDAKRLKDLGDGIFAFAMTFLIITIDLPKTPLPMLDNELAKIVPDLFTYVLSFFLLAIYWVTNHIQMKNIKRADSRLIWITILLFLLVVFVPLTTDLYAFYDGSVTAALAFNLNCFLIALTFTLQWHHLVANQMHHEEFTKEEIRERYQLCQLLVAISLIAMAVACWWPVWSIWVYLIILCNRIYVRFLRRTSL
jgi:uncharacterized membrane protein